MKTHTPKTSVVHQAVNLAVKPAVKAAVASIPSIFVPLSSLFLSPANVRKQPSKTVEENIEELAAMIDAQGLLQALQVTQQGSQASGFRYAVEAGGRRFRALTLLITQGKLNADALIEVKVIDVAHAVEVSLSENLSQEPMHPADEFDAYRVLVDQGQSFEVISHKFGVTVVHIQRRLKMAQVAPELLGFYRAGEATLDQIMALASVDDPERQLQVWKGLPPHNRHAHVIKRKLSEDELPATDERVVVVGLANYLAAGGSLRADLFSDEGKQYLTDPALVDMMLGELLEQEATKLRDEGWAWVEVFESYGYDERQLHRRLPKSYLDETEQQVSARTALQAQHEALSIAAEEAADDDGDWEKAQKLSGQADTIEVQIAALHESRLDLTAFDKSVAGAVVTVSNGALFVHRGLAHSSNAQGGQGAASAGSSTGRGGDASTRPDVPEKLMLNLTSQRTAAIQALMTSNYQVTLVALAHRMAMTVLRPHDFGGHALKLNLTQCRSTLEKHSPSLPRSSAAQVLDAQRKKWLDYLPTDPGAWFDWLLAQPQDTVLSLIVFATAQCADAVQGRSGGEDAAAPLARALSLDMADWWAPTPENYLDLVPKGKLIEAVTETAGGQVAAAMVKLKKEGAIAHAHQHVAGHRWLPAPLRSQRVADAAAVEALPPVNTDGGESDADAEAAQRMEDEMEGAAVAA